MAHFAVIRKKTILIPVILIGIVLVLLNFNLAHAQDETQDPKRLQNITVDTIEYIWQLKFRSDNSIACEFTVDHPDLPSNEEIESGCGATLFDDWKNSDTCVNTESSDESTCTGLTLFNVNSNPIHKQISVQLPVPEVRLSLGGCYYNQSSDFCIGNPILIFKGFEPLPNESIVQIMGTLGEQDVYCESDSCSIALNSTGTQGVALSFWGNSSYGDSTEIYSALVRVIPVEGRSDSYRVDVISSQWSGKNPPSCSDIWNVFPESVDLPAWLSSPANAVELQSQKSLYYLAAALIRNGVVDASQCEHNGLANSVTANECGVTAAASKIEYWQNQFDQEILAVSREDGIPAKLLKNIFLRESQFWPGEYSSRYEVGLGQFTQNGADTILLWNQDFYNAFCPLVLDEWNCQKGFARLGTYGQAILRGALLQTMNASCSTCSDRIDLSKANFSIHVFAQSLEANCSQVYQVIYNTTTNEPAAVANYTDLWRFTLINYNAGAGCLSNAIYRTWNADTPIDWAHVAANLEPACRNAVDYVFDVSDGDTDNRIVFSTPLPTATNTPYITRVPTRTFTPTRTLTITMTPRPTLSPTPTFVVVPSETPTSSPTVSRTPTKTMVPTFTKTPTITRTPTGTRTPTRTPSPTVTATPSPT